MAASVEKPNFAVSEDDIAEATRAALGPRASIDSYDATLIQEPGVGFLGVHFIITVRARSLPGQPIVVISMFAKMLPPFVGPAHFIKAFPTESAFLRKLQGPLDDALKSPDGKEGPKWGPKCYLAREDLVIFENLSLQGYKGCDEQHDLPIEYIRVMCKALTRFHAAGLLFAQKHGREAATELCPELNDNVLFSNDYNWAGPATRNSSVDALATVLSSMLSPEEKPRLKELQEKLHELSRGMWDAFEKAKIGPLVPLHGDCHPNNFLFKFDDKGNPLDAILIDFQLARFNVPALDLVFLINLSASAESVEEHWDELLRFYYEELGHETARCGLPIEEILTFEDFLASTERVRMIAVYLACMYSTVIFAPRMELGKIMMDPYDYRRFILGCRAAETLRWFESEPKYRTKVEKLLRKVLEL